MNRDAADHDAGVPFVDLDRAHRLIEGELDEAILGVVRRGDFILGGAVAELEEAFARYIGVEHAIGVGSGTAALTIAALSCGLGPGDEVIVPAHTYIASALGMELAGARSVFCDVDPRTGLIDLDSAAAMVGERTAAILPVHLYGQLCDMAAVEAFADRHALAIIEDAAQAHGARRDGRSAGASGRAAAFSFYPSKNLGAFGDGGMVCTSDPDVAARARRLRHLGQRAKGEHVEIGMNERLDTIQAAVLGVKLPHLDAANESRRDSAARYRDRLSGSLAILPSEGGEDCVYHIYPVRVDERDRVAAELRERGIGIGVHYSPAVHQQPPFIERYAEAPVAARWAAEELSLPMFPFMDPSEVDRVADALLELAGPAPEPAVSR